MLLFFSMFLTIFAYRGVELKLGPVLEATSYLYVAVLSYIFLQEHISKRKKWGLVLIILGIVVSNLG
ncbi:MAG: EamA family transporter, partial [Eubacteriales bacterium]|nr:EamA family transporter [Eubacteriales bacterium]